MLNQHSEDYKPDSRVFNNWLRVELRFPLVSNQAPLHATSTSMSPNLPPKPGELCLASAAAIILDNTWLGCITDCHSQTCVLAFGAGTSGEDWVRSKPMVLQNTLSWIKTKEHLIRSIYYLTKLILKGRTILNYSWEELTLLSKLMSQATLSTAALSTEYFCKYD